MCLPGKIKVKRKRKNTNQRTPDSPGKIKQLPHNKDMSVLVNVKLS